MKKDELNIIIIDSSYIICKGLSAILVELDKKLRIFFADDVLSLKTFNLKEKSNIIFINPLLFQNKTKEFISIKKEFDNTIWIGIINNLFDHQVLSLFDENIFTYDDADQINNIIKILFQKMLNKKDFENQQDTLTNRENEILKLLVKGNSNKEIANKLHISTNTVITHRKNISQKTGIKSLSGLTIYAVVNGIVSINDYPTIK